jgi:hypothetical protein
MSDPVSSSRRSKAWFVCGILFGTVCFMVGRFTAPRTIVTTVAQPVENIAAKEGNSQLPAAVPVTNSNSSLSSRNTASLPGWDEKQWEQILSQPGSPARNAAMAAMLENLAMVNPDRGMSLAQGEGNLKLREILVQAAVRGWARTSPTNAAQWALALSDSNDRERALSSAFAGMVVADPNAAVQFGKSLIHDHAENSVSYGASLIEALGDAGHFETAARMAADGGEGIRSGWMASAYSRWAEFQPDQAAAAASAITDPSIRNEALHGIVGGWSAADPVALVHFAQQLPADHDRDSILSQALGSWVKRDPEEASRWINERGTGPELDEGVASVATLESIKPDVAVGWAESVANPKLRSETLTMVIRNWLSTDLQAAHRYFENTKNLLPEDRQELTEVFSNFSHEAASQ